MGPATITLDRKTVSFAAFLVEHGYFADMLKDDTLEDKLYAERLLVLKIQHYHACWQQHLEYYETEPWNPLVVGVWEHEPGKRKLTESYVITQLNDVLAPATQAKMARTLGTFKCIRPIPEDMPYVYGRMAWYSNSLKAGGKAYAARMELKALLPQHLHKYISKLRGWSAEPKWIYLIMHYSQAEWMGMCREAKDQLKRTPSLQPDWYSQSSKAELWATCRIKPEEYNDIATYINPVDLYLCASGEVHPDDVHTYVLHQKSLFDTDMIATGFGRKPKSVRIGYAAA